MLSLQGALVPALRMCPFYITGICLADVRRSTQQIALVWSMPPSTWELFLGIGVMLMESVLVKFETTVPPLAYVRRPWHF